MRRKSVKLLFLLGCLGLLIAGVLWSPWPRRGDPVRDLRNIGIAYHNYLDSVGLMPQSLDDLDYLLIEPAPSLPYVSDSLTQMVFTPKKTDLQPYVLLGTAESATAKLPQILAYERQVPESGGRVVLANAHVVHMTAEEFAAVQVQLDPLYIPLK